MGLGMAILPTAASAQGVLFVEGDKVGVGVATPTSLLHLQANDGTAIVKVEETSGTSALRTQFQMINNGPVNTQHETGVAIWRQQFQDNAYTLTKNGTGGNEMTIIAGSGNMTIRGSLFTAGPSCAAGCDAVFDPSYDLESIQEHAENMWTSGHLPAIGPTEPHQQINIPEKMGGMLNELEKAHIYIEQLHQKLSDQEDRLSRLESMLNDGQ
jgi:hypothetical protein